MFRASCGMLKLLPDFFFFLIIFFLPMYINHCISMLRIDELVSMEISAVYLNSMMPLSAEMWWIIMCKYFLYWFKFKHHMFIGHIVSSLHLLKERIFFFVCILNLVFKFGLCLYFPHLLYFPQNYFSQHSGCFFLYL